MQQVPVLDEVGPAEHDDGVGEHDEVADEDAERVRLERLDGGVAVAANEKRRSNYSHTFLFDLIPELIMVGFVSSIEEHAAADTVFGTGRNGACYYMCMWRYGLGNGAALAVQ